MTRLDADVERVALRLYEGLDTAVSLSAAIKLRYSMWDDLVKSKVDPKHYLDSPWGTEKFRRDYQACEFLRKDADLPGLSPKERIKLTTAGFWATEAQCTATNARMMQFLDNPVIDCAQDVRILDFIEDVRLLIARVLGPIPNGVQPAFGKGSVFEKKVYTCGRHYTLGDKMSQNVACTPRALAYMDTLVYKTAWGHALLTELPYRSAPTVVPGNRFGTVPKTSVIDRPIGVEPGGNVFVQLGLGQYIRSRLKMVAKIDIKKGQSLHRQLARVASLRGELATIDLSSASDTVALRVVQLLLPQAWFELLSDLRSSKTLVDGKWVKLEKFSSMGNGFTFELETLIFWALSRVATDQLNPCERVYVYGDDIIVPTSSFNDVAAVLRYFGFTLNTRKSFSDGVFKESCGADYFNGVWVRPHYLLNHPSAPTEWISLLNGLWRASGYGANTRSFRKARLACFDQIPKNLRKCCGPEELGDLVIHAHPNRWRYYWKEQTRIFHVVRPISPRVPLERFKPGIQLALALYGVPSSGMVPRKGGQDVTTGYRVGIHPYS